MAADGTDATEPRLAATVDDEPTAANASAPAERLLSDLPVEVIERIAASLPTPRDLAAANATSRLFRGAPGERSPVEHALRERAHARGHWSALPDTLPECACNWTAELLAREAVFELARSHAHAAAARMQARFSAFVDADGGVHTCGEEAALAGVSGTRSPLALGLPGMRAVLVPTRVPSLSAARVVAVAAGRDYMLALSDVGAVYGCGRNDAGQLGTGDDDERHAFVRVQALAGEAIVCIAAGVGHSLALTLAGSAFSWGNNGWGQLGHGDTEDRWEPTRIEALDGVRVGGLGAGQVHTLLLSTSGAAYSCGSGSSGRLGHGDQLVQHTPTRIEALAGVRAVHVSAGGAHSLVVDATGGVHSFGRGRSGQLGHGDDITQPVPTPIAALAGVRAVRAYAGNDSSAVLGADGSVHAFGANRYHQLGLDGQLGPGAASVTEPALALLPGRGASCSFGPGHALYVTADGAAYSCGKQSAALGLGVSAADGAGRVHSLTRIEQLPPVYTRDVDGDDACSALVAGMAADSTDATEPRLAATVDDEQTAANASAPALRLLSDLPAEVIERIAASLPTRRDLAAANATARLFRGAPGERSPVEHALRERARAREHGRSQPDTLPAGALNWTAELLAGEALIELARSHTHAAATSMLLCFSAFVGADGGLHTCGEDADADVGGVAPPPVVGHLDAPAVVVPTRVPSLSAVRVVAVAAGFAHLLALSEAGAMYGCGENGSGQLGLGDTVTRSGFEQVRGVETQLVVCIAAGNYHSLALTADGCAYSWGGNSWGQLGHGDTEDRLESTRIEALDGVRVGGVAAGGRHTLLLSAHGVVYSCGWGSSGRLGHSDQEVQLTPRSIEALAGVRAVHVSAGGAHSLVVDAAGGVHSFGYGCSGQLGHGDGITQRVPTPIAALAGVRAVRAYAGNNSSAVLGADGSVHAFGENRCHQLGLDGQLGPGAPSVVEPALVRLPGRGSSCSFGPRHALYVTSDGAAHACGARSAALGIGVSAVDRVWRLHLLTRIEQLPPVHTRVVDGDAAC